MSNQDKTKKEEQKVARKEYTRHDDKQIAFDKEIVPFQRNLLIIRETYTAIFSKKYGMKNFYDALGCTTDDFSNILTRNILSPRLHKIISEKLHSFGVEKSSLRLVNALEFELPDKITASLDDYFKKETSKADKDWILKDLRISIFDAYFEKHKYMAGLLLVCYNIASCSDDFVENSLDKAYEILNELDEIDFSQINVKSRQFAKYVNQLAKNLTSLEEVFPEFYALVQQMKEEKSAQSIMNEISNNLKSLNDMMLTSADTKSDSCINMLKEISETMQNIYSKMQ